MGLRPICPSSPRPSRRRHVAVRHVAPVAGSAPIGMLNALIMRLVLSRSEMYSWKTSSTTSMKSGLSAFTGRSELRTAVKKGPTRAGGLGRPR